MFFVVWILQCAFLAALVCVVYQEPPHPLSMTEQNWHDYCVHWIPLQSVICILSSIQYYQQQQDGWMSWFIVGIHIFMGMYFTLLLALIPPSEYTLIQHNLPWTWSISWLLLLWQGCTLSRHIFLVQ